MRSFLCSAPAQKTGAEFGGVHLGLDGLGRPSSGHVFLAVGAKARTRPSEVQNVHWIRTRCARGRDCSPPAAQRGAGGRTACLASARGSRRGGDPHRALWEQIDRCC